VKPLILALISIAAAIGSVAPTHAGATRIVVLIVGDGIRWQEVFTGADPTLLNDAKGGSWIPTDVLRKRYWRDDVKERRKILMPFIWGTVAQKGQIFGNRALGSNATVSNGQAFSYPGYDEMSVGKPDPRIDSNEFGPNPNVSVFEWLAHQKDFSDRVAVFGSWDTFHDIFNVARSRLPVYSGPDILEAAPGAANHDLLAELYRTTTRIDYDDPPDSLVQLALLDYLKIRQPRAMFVGYGEPDSWAHAGRYDLVVQSIQNFDHFVGQLWATLQSMPAYRDQTTLIVTTDHGRGGGLTEWKEHGDEEKGSENIWIAVMGPDTPALGERQKAPPVIQAQIAATVAAFVGQDYHAAVPGVAAPLPDILGH
jgi:arylsulfatase A-like enzyme